MSHMSNSRQKLNQVIFANHNEEYGVYALRANYGTTIFKSLFFMILGVASVLSVTYYLSDKNNNGPDLSGQVPLDSTFVIPFNLPPEEIIEPAKGKKNSPDDPGKPSSSENSQITVVDSTSVEPSASFTEAITATTSVTTNGTGNENSQGSRSNGSLLGAPDSATKIKDPFEVDSEPLFEGGLPALYRFVSSHLRYPGRASDEGKEGTVYVKFVVDETGKVGNLRLLNMAGYGMDEEALRVVSMIPNFKSPAKVRGTAVKVYYQMPIRFRFR
jgi:protein TonB